MLLHMRGGTGSREGNSLDRRAQHPLLTGTLTDQTGSSWWCWWRALQRGCWQLPARPHKLSSACKPAPPPRQSWVLPQRCRCWGWKIGQIWTKAWEALVSNANIMWFVIRRDQKWLLFFLRWTMDMYPWLKFQFLKNHFWHLWVGFDRRLPFTNNNDQHYTIYMR